MSESAARAQRAAALEEKRKRLEELKARRSQRGADSAAVSAKVASSSNLDEYIDDLLKQPGAAPATAAATTTTSATPAAATAAEQEAPKTQPAGDAADNVIAEKAAPVAPAAPVKKVETFTVSTQTEEEDFPEQPTPEQDEEAGDEDKQADGADEDGKDAAEKANEEEGEDPKILSSEELKTEIASKPFSDFLNTASKKVERVLGTPQLADLLVDYVGEMDGVKRSESKVSDGSVYLASRQLYECQKWTKNRDVTDLHWSPLHRELMLSTYDMPLSANSTTQLSKGSAAVSAVSPTDTSSSSLTPRSGELQSDGLALVWSLAMPGRPEHIFTCGSPVLAGRFHPTEAPLVIGGCQSGQLVVWDIRAGRLPVQRSSLTTVANGSKGHAHPICSMEFIEGGTGLVTAAIDGKVNFWSISNLRDPAESLQVGDSASCCTIAPESESLLLGDGNGGLYTIQSASSTQGQRTARRAVRKFDVTSSDPGQAKDGGAGSGGGGDDEKAKTAIPGHFGMITSVSAKTIPVGAHARQAGIAKGFLRGSGGLIVTSGVDWSTKLWAPAYSDQPLMSWVSPSYDYMSDVQWSPTHPSLFATASSTGIVGLWNLASSLEEPITGVDGIAVEPDAASTGQRGLNKLKWSADGRRMAVAAGDRVHVLSLSEDVVRQKGDEDHRLMSHLVSRGLVERE